MYKAEWNPVIPWTIEQQLKSYTEVEGHTDRHEILYHTWHQNSRWFSRILEYTVKSYPKYSQHNVTHCQSIIHNIECLLGEDGIRSLSATDCYVILMTVYIHDIGMCITQDQKYAIATAEKFQENLTDEQKIFLENFLNEICEQRRVSYEESQRCLPPILYRQMLETSLFLEELIVDYHRKSHAEASSDWLKQILEKQDETSGALAITGIPTRIHLAIAECARLHGVDPLENVIRDLMKLPQDDNGFALDSYHPRFVAVLLLIGDALDIDNGRFNLYARTMAGGTLGEISELHYRKHEAIRSLRITEKKIYIRANCTDSIEMRMIRNQLNWLERFVKECSYLWTSIAPLGFRKSLPQVDFKEISLKGKAIAENLVRARFQLSQRKAFKLLEGTNLYDDSQYIFLREMLQNALDATKLQYWNDLVSSDFQADSKTDIVSANHELPFRKYPVKVKFNLCKRKSGSTETMPIMLDDIASNHKGYEFGVNVSVQDYGIGIGAEDVDAISLVGTSHDAHKDVVRNMPEWLHPTGQFGIGLQALFQADKVFSCVTRTHRDECYEMSFNSGAHSDGYISIIPRDLKKESIPYGTTFSLFVPYQKKKAPHDSKESRVSMDPCDEKYEEIRCLNESLALMRQLEKEVDQWIGNCLFPVILQEECMDESILNSDWNNKLSYYGCDFFEKVTYISTKGGKPAERIPEEEYEKNLCWILQNNKGIQQGELADKSASYYMDIENNRLNIFCLSEKCFFVCSPQRILQFVDKKRWFGTSEEEKECNKVKIFLKGLFVADICYKECELIEYIDLQSDKLQEHLYMSRGKFTEQGEEILRDQLLPTLRDTLHRVLAHINTITLQHINENKALISTEVLEQFQRTYVELNNGVDISDNIYYLTKIKQLEKHLQSNDPFCFTLSSWKAEEKDVGLLFYRKNKSVTYKNIFNEENEEQQYAGRFEKDFEDIIQRLRNSNPDLFSVALSAFQKRRRDICKLIKDDVIPNKMDGEAGDLKELKWLSGAMIFYAMLSFYTTQKKIVQKGCAVSNDKPCGWDWLNRCIASELEFLYNTIRPMHIQSIFKKNINDRFFVPVYHEFYSQEHKHRYSVSELMFREHQLAIFSFRDSERSPWRHLMVKLYPLKQQPAYQKLVDDYSNTWLKQTLEKDGANILDVLAAVPTNSKDCSIRWAFLDQWHSKIVESLKNDIGISKGDRLENKKNYRSMGENQICRWLLRKFPTVSMGSDFDGNNRINILSTICDKPVFYDARMVDLHMKKAKEMHDSFNAQRFSSYPWDGLDELRCKGDISSSILSVSRGTIPEESKKNRTLLAFKSNMPKDTKIQYRPFLEDCSNESDEPKFVEINTFFQLLDKLKETFNVMVRFMSSLQPEDMEKCSSILDFGIESLIELINKYLKAQRMYIFYQNIDIKIVKKIHEFRIERPNDSVSKELQTPINVRAKVVQDFILKKFYENLADHKNSKDSLSFEVMNRYSLICVFLLELYHVNEDPQEDQSKLFDEINKILKDGGINLEINENIYNNKENINKNFAYIAQTIEKGNEIKRYDLRYQFLEQACSWYWDNVWNKQNPKNLIDFTQKHLQCKQTDQQLEDLYKVQIRRIFCAAITCAKDEK